jgi:hypothetical protein
MVFAEALIAESADSAHAAELELFGQFVGEWEAEITYYKNGDPSPSVPGEWLWGWTLEGRAVQDVFIVPSRSEQYRTGSGPSVYGTTLRQFDPNLGAWRVVWSSPLTGLQMPFIARKVGGEIVLEATTEDGELVHWTFSNITADAYNWRAESSTDHGQTWTLHQRMSVTRKRD